MKIIFLTLITFLISVYAFAIAPITGPKNVCEGSSVSLTDATPGGSWSSAGTAIVYVGTSGTVYGLNPGNALITYDVSGIFDTFRIFVDPLPYPDTMSGGGFYCAGGAGIAVGLRDSRSGVNYQLYYLASPIGSAMAGTGSAISFGLHTGIGTYTSKGINAITGCTRNIVGNATVSTTSSPAASVSLSCSPNDTVCPGIVVTYTAIPFLGGSSPSYTWYINGVITGASGTTFSYTPSNGDVVSVHMASSLTCALPASASITMVVDPMPPVSGAADVCIGATISLTDAATGGTWVSSDPSVATIATIGGSIGISTGVAAGTSTLTYMLATGCYATRVITVLPLPAISASSSRACGGSYKLSAISSVTDYSWAPSSGLSCTTCDTTSVSPLTTTTYIVTGTDTNGCSGTAGVLVNGNRICGHITFTPGKSPDSLDIRVWLIRYNALDSSIIALDSVNACIIDSIGYYEFNGKPAGNYFVKAKLLHATTGASGYIPTYGLSSTSWTSATSVAHAFSSDSLHISMSYGTVPSGPGFISGYVYSGAGKGTAEGPVSGMLIYLQDLKGKVLTHTYTNSSGYYSFKKIGYGNYIVHPEQYEYNTINSGIIPLFGEAPTVTNVTFKQYTWSGIIKPFTMQITPASTTSVFAASSISLFPNPSNGVLNMQWNEQAPCIGKIIVTDITGRERYNRSIDITMASGHSQISLDNIANGMYVISITTGTTNYSSKLMIQH